MPDPSGDPPRGVGSPDATGTRMPRGRVLVLGEALVDIVIDARGESREHVGGSPLNVALGLRRLGHDVDFATTLGPDARGERIRALLAEAGVRLASSESPESSAVPTSTALARLDGSGAATYEFDLHFDLPPTSPPPGTGHAHTGSIGALLAPGDASVRVAMDAVRRSGTLSYDPNVRPSIMGPADVVRARVAELVARSDVVKASDDDLAFLYPDEGVVEVLERWCSFGPKLVVVTLGAAGVIFRTRSSPTPETLASTAAHVVDTVGAGDSFMAGLLSGLLDLGLLGSTDAGARLGAAGTDDVRPAIERGLATSAVTVGRAGAYAPTREDL